MRGAALLADDRGSHARKPAPPPPLIRMSLWPHMTPAAADEFATYVVTVVVVVDFETTFGAGESRLRRVASSGREMRRLDIGLAGWPAGAPMARR